MTKEDIKSVWVAGLHEREQFPSPLASLFSSLAPRRLLESESPCLPLCLSPVTKNKHSPQEAGEDNEE